MPQAQEFPLLAEEKVVFWQWEIWEIWEIVQFQSNFYKRWVLHRSSGAVDSVFSKAQGLHLYATFVLIGTPDYSNGVMVSCPY